MDQADGVERVQRLRDLEHAVPELRDRVDLVQAGPADVLGDQVRPLPGLPEVVHPEHVRVLHGRQGLGLPAEAPPRLGAVRPPDELDGDLAPELEVLGEEHRPHGPLPQRPMKAIPLAERVGHEGGGRCVGHWVPGDSIRALWHAEATPAEHPGGARSRRSPKGALLEQGADAIPLMEMLLVPIAFVLLMGTIVVGGALFLWCMASSSGWADLAKRFPAQGATPEKTWNRTSGFLDGERFRHAVDVGVGPAGLSLTMFALFGPGFAPIQVPWEQVSVGEEKSVGGRPTTPLVLGGPEGVSLDLDGKAGAGVREASRKYATG
jgi:hypothetical protein